MLVPKEKGDCKNEGFGLGLGFRVLGFEGLRFRVCTMSWGFGIGTRPLGCNVNINIRGGNHLGEVWGGEIQVVIIIVIITLITIIVIVIVIVIVIIIIVIVIIVIIIIIIIITVGPRCLRTKARGRCGALAGHVLVEGSDFLN